MSDETEVAYEQGSRMAWRAMLALCLRNLGYDANDVTHAKWILEREEAVSQLRSLCREFGDNEWPDDLHLGDVIDKHLGRHLDSPTEELPLNRPSQNAHPRKKTLTPAPGRGLLVVLGSFRVCLCLPGPLVRGGASYSKRPTGRRRHTRWTR